MKWGEAIGDEVRKVMSCKRSERTVYHGKDWGCGVAAYPVCLQIRKDIGRQCWASLDSLNVDHYLAVFFSVSFAVINFNHYYNVLLNLVSLLANHQQSFSMHYFSLYIIYLV